jgi:cytochrome c oxidase accessory protein FixG
VSRIDPSPSLDEVASLQADGSRRYVHPADVKGPHDRARRLVFAGLIVVLLGLPWVQIGGHPAILLDIPHRQFFLLGEAYNAQDAWLLFFLLTGVGFSLVATTTLFGRAWCGYACPQTVFIEGVFRRIERLIEGPREARLKLERAPWGPEKIARKAVKQALFLAVSVIIAHAVLGYFFPIRTLVQLVSAGPRAHLEAFVWTTAVTALVYFDFGWFREQFCVIMCPYGRLQSAMTDRDTIQVGYDARRGEPRGKLKVLGRGDCVDCRRCIHVCPTGIDIRQGLQLDCIGCTACIDACDEVMIKVGQPAGLIRYDSERGFAGEKTKIWRPRTAAYLAAGLLGLAAVSFALHARQSFEVNILRSPTPYTLDEGEVRNVLRLHLVGKGSAVATYQIEALGPASDRVIISRPTVELSGSGSVEIPVIVHVPLADFHGSFPVQIRIRGPRGERVVSTSFMGPGR